MLSFLKIPSLTVSLKFIKQNELYERKNHLSSTYRSQSHQLPSLPRMAVGEGTLSRIPLGSLLSSSAAQALSVTQGPSEMI